MSSKIYSAFAAVAAAMITFVAPVLVADPSPQPIGAPGNKGMGFDQGKTTHHFKLLPDGGIIEITANDPADVPTRDGIRQHLTKMETMFEQGDFSAPMLVHGQTPPGADTMKRLKDQLHCTTENVPTGGQLHIATSNPEARSAVYDFLRFQIREFKTGDSTAEPTLAKRPHPANNLGHDARPAPP